MLTQESIRHTEIELVANTMLVEVEPVLAIRKSDAFDVDARIPCLLGEPVRRVRRDQVIVGAEDNQSRRGGGVDVSRGSYELVSIWELLRTAAHIVGVEPARHV